MTKDTAMTKGQILPIILRFALPFLLGELIEQLYTVVDSIVVGRYLGVNALASVGATGSVTYLVVDFCIGCCYGFGIPLAQRFGARDQKGFMMYLSHAIYYASAIAVVTTVTTAIFCRTILQCMGTPSAILNGAHRYLLILFLAIPFTTLYNLTVSVMMALGDSKSPFWCMVASTLINVVLDLLFVLVFSMGVGGAAFATLLAQFFGGMIGIWFLKKKYSDILQFHKKDWKIRPYIFLRLTVMSLPMGLQYSINAIGSIILQVAINGLSTTAIAAFTAGSKIKQVFLCPYDALGGAVATFTGQNYGAGKMSRVKKGVRQSIMVAIVYSLVVAFVFTVFGKELALFFVPKNKIEVLQATKQYFLLSGIFYFELAFLFVTRSAVQGLGRGKYAICSSLFEMGARIIVAFLLVPTFGFVGVCLNEGATWFGGCIVIVPIYAMIVRKEKQKINQR